MKKIHTIIALLLLSLAASAQPVINNAEDFVIGTVLKFQLCNSSGVLSGSSGANQTWNFANLSALPDTITEWMVTPASTPYADSFPPANLVEKYSDGSYVYANKQGSNNYLVGYIDSLNGVNIHYTKAPIFAHRPLTFGYNITDTLADTFTSGTYDFSGTGTTNLNADAYGTLILPNGTYNNVLRLVISQVITDTIRQTHAVSSTYVYSTVWFDGVHSSALLKIDSTYNAFNGASKTVQYLLIETTPSGITNVNSDMGLSIYPNPAANVLNISAGHEGKLIISDIEGRTIQNMDVREGQMKISTEELGIGMYRLTYTSHCFSETQKLLIQK